MNVKSKKMLITGGAGFIGSAVVRHIINNTDHSVINVDKLKVEKSVKVGRFPWGVVISPDK